MTNVPHQYRQLGECLEKSVNFTTKCAQGIDTSLCQSVSQMNYLVSISRQCTLRRACYSRWGCPQTVKPQSQGHIPQAQMFPSKSSCFGSIALRGEEDLQLSSGPSFNCWRADSVRSVSQDWPRLATSFQMNFECVRRQTIWCSAVLHKAPGLETL